MAVTTHQVKVPRLHRFTPDVQAIYLTDNGRALCGQHLGFSAALTGRDISGQEIYRLTQADADYWRKHFQQERGILRLPSCEDCGKVWTR